MEEVVVVADVDKVCLLPQSTSAKCNIEEKTRSTIEEAKKIREHQGNHEVEVSCGGETDLYDHYKSCQKNPGHCHFIPAQDFKKEHLPSGYRDKVILDWIKAEADLTCRLVSNYTSDSRPQFFPGSQNPYPFYEDSGGNWLRTGTGCVSCVYKYTKDKKYCECKQCNRPSKVWGKVVIVTVAHLVFDSEEASHTFCNFSCDTSTDDVSFCRTLRGLEVEYCDIKGDMCMMTCVTHDAGLVDKLVKMCDRRLKLFEKVRDKYWLDQWKDMFDPGMSYVTDPTPGFVVVISHPHGCSKQISVGEWKHRQTQGESVNYHEKAEFVSSSYRYNAATCPGSSGAPVIRLLEKGSVGWWWLLYSHPHSGGDAGNNNYSGSMEEFVSFPPSSSDQLRTKVFVYGILAYFSWSSLIAITVGWYMTGEWSQDSLWGVLYVMMILAFCLSCIPWFRQGRGFQWFLVILLLLYSLIMFVGTLLVDDHIVLRVILGVLCVILFVDFVLYFMWAKSTTSLTSYNIQRKLRQRTRVKKTTKTQETIAVPVAKKRHHLHHHRQQQ